MVINDSALFENLVVGIIISLFLMFFVFLITKSIVERIKENRDVKYRLKKKNRVSFSRLIFIDVMWITCLMLSLWKDSQYWMDYHVKDYQSVSEVVKSITYKSNYRSTGSWIVKIQGREKTFDLSKEQRKLINENEVHTIIYAKRTGMILVVQ